MNIWKFEYLTLFRSPIHRSEVIMSKLQSSGRQMTLDDDIGNPLTHERRHKVLAVFNSWLTYSFPNSVRNWALKNGHGKEGVESGMTNRVIRSHFPSDLKSISDCLDSVERSIDWDRFTDTASISRKKKPNRLSSSDTIGLNKSNFRFSIPIVPTYLFQCGTRDARESAWSGVSEGAGVCSFIKLSRERNTHHTRYYALARDDWDLKTRNIWELNV